MKLLKKRNKDKSEKRRRKYAKQKTLSKNVHIFFLNALCALLKKNRSAIYHFLGFFPNNLGSSNKMHMHEVQTILTMCLRICLQ